MILPEDEEYESIFTLDGLTDQETVEPENRESKQESEADLDKKITATLEDFPVNNWDSNNDAQLIVDWYNERRGKWPKNHSMIFSYRARFQTLTQSMMRDNCSIMQ